MLNEIKVLTKIQLCNFFGINEALKSKDAKSRNKIYTTVIAFIILAIMLCTQVGGSTYALITFGMESVIPSMVGSTVSGMALLLSIFRAGPTLFSKKAYEMTVCLPVKIISIVISRFMNLYIYNLIFSTVIIGSSVSVSAFCGNQSLIFYPTMILGIFIIPLLPILLATVIGTVGYYFASKVSKKNLVNMLWQVGIIAIVIYFTSSTPGSITEDIAGQLSQQMIESERFYPLLKLFSRGVNGNILYFLLFAAISIGLTLGVLILISKFYKKICVGITSTVAKRNFKMSKQKSRGVLKTLYLRETKRYFSSSTYVMNTIIGFILAALAGIALAFLGIESLCEEIGIPYWILTRILPLVLGTLCNTMPITAASISIEGRNFWLIKSLPITMKNVANAKILLNLTFAIPACLIGSTGLYFALGGNIIDVIFIYLIPLVIVLFGSVTGLYMNILNPVLDWDSEVVPVKQSKASMMTMFSLILSEFGAMIVYFMTPNDFKTIVNIIITVVFALGSMYIYKKIIETDLKKIK